MKKFIFFVLANLAYLPFVFSQQQVSGLVMDASSKEALIGVTVLVTGTSTGAVTDVDGKFQLNVKEGATSLTISYIGYETQEVSITHKPLVISLQPSIVSLNQVIVSASRDAQLRSDAPVAISTISPQLIQETKATSLDQLLNKTTGVFMVDLGNEQQSMSIRQPLSFKSLFLYLEDGLPIRPTGVFNHNALIEMNMQSLKTVEVIRGPSSALYGSEAIGGAINFITKKPSAVPTAHFSWQGDSEGYSRVNFNVGNTSKKGVGVAIGGYYAKREDGFREHSDMDKLAITANISYRFSPKLYLSTTTSMVDFHTDMTGSLDEDRFYSKEYGSVQTFTERTVKAFRIQSKLTYDWNASASTAFRLFFRDNSIGQIPSYRVKDDYSAWNNPTGDRNLAHGEINENAFRSYGFLIQHKQDLSEKLTVRGGVSIDYSPTEYFANYIKIDKTDDGIYSGYENDPDSLLTRYDVDLTNLATYAQVEFRPTEEFNIIASLRYDRFNYGYDNYLPEEAFSGAPDATNRFNALTPRIGFTYNHNDLGFYGNYSKGFVPPQVGELYRGVKVPTLNPAIYHNYEVGAWWALPNQKGFLDVAIYQLDGTDEIISVQLDNGSRENRNAGKTRHRGIEASFRYEPVKGLQIRLGGTIASHTFEEYVENGTEFNGNDMDRAPRMLSNSEITYRPSFLKGFRIALEWQHMDEYYMDAANTKEYEGFDVFNLRAGYQIGNFELWGNLMNVTDKLYATNASLSRWGESYTPGLPRLLQFGIGYKFSGKN